uniref:Sm domain-containing protein n=1 Tax=Catharus ustulatus TaxID=91951 RepID=A0A8C3UEN3_CATUS
YMVYITYMMSLPSICGTLHSVDQYLNIKLMDISVTDPKKCPHMLSVKNRFIRGSVVHYVQLPADPSPNSGSPLPKLGFPPSPRSPSPP